MTYNEIIKQVSKELDYPEKLVDKSYKLYWRFIRETIENLPLMSDINKDDFDKMKTSFNIAGLGKLYCSFDKMDFLKNKYKNHKIKYDKYKED